MHKTTLLAAAGLTALLPISLVLGRGGGTISGVSRMPRNLATAFPSCGTTGCHNGFPSFNVDMAIDGSTSVGMGATVAMKTTVSGANLSSSRGGFTLESSKGAFTAGTTTRTGTTASGRAAITHRNSLNRSWSFTWKAPTTAGLVTMFAVGNAADGNGRTSGDQWGWHGPDGSTPGTPHRVFVNGAKITSTGVGCEGADKFRPLLGMVKAPAVNSTFDTEVYNLPVGAPSLTVLGLSNRTFGALPLPLPLATLGGGKCILRISLDVTQVAIATGGTQKGSGATKIKWGIPNITSLRNLPLYFQSLTIDSKANALGISFSNALSTTIQ